jgi:hypothetical protein
MSAWPETSLMLTTVEIPGLYVQPDRSLFAAFDNIVAKVAKDSPLELTLSVTNPTPVDANVRVLCESSVDAMKPLPENALFGRSVLRLATGETKTVSFKK